MKEFINKIITNFIFNNINNYEQFSIINNIIINKKFIMKQIIQIKTFIKKYYI